jgi:hypothetical protein
LPFFCTAFLVCLSFHRFGGTSVAIQPWVSDHKKTTDGTRRFSMLCKKSKQELFFTLLQTNIYYGVFFSKTSANHMGVMTAAEPLRCSWSG